MHELITFNVILKLININRSILNKNNIKKSEEVDEIEFD